MNAFAALLAHTPIHVYVHAPYLFVFAQMQEQKEAELGAQEEELLARFGAAMEMTDDIPGTPPLSVAPGSSSTERGSVDADSLRKSLSTALEQQPHQGRGPELEEADGAGAGGEEAQRL